MYKRNFIKEPYYFLKMKSKTKSLTKVLSEEYLDFLDAVSKELMFLKDTKKNLDIFSFAIWLRKKNLQKIISEYKNIKKGQVPLGQLFHIPSSNIPMSFAYTLIIGILTGNKNIVRIPEKSIEYAKKISRIFIKLKKRYPSIVNNNTLVYYKKNKKLTECLSLESDGRIFWGTDETINELKKVNSKPNSRDVFFNDKTSISIINLNKIFNLSQKNIIKLCRNFFNDTYLFDQNACTSPKIIIWIGKKNKKNINIFWEKLYLIIKKNYTLTNFMATDKFFITTTFLAKNLKQNYKIKNFENNINVIECKKLNNIKNLFSRWGLFYEMKYNNIKEIKIPMSKNYQTISYFGLNKKQKEEIFRNNTLKNFNRIVPIGSTMNFQLTWDGYDLINYLTRRIEIK